MLSNAIPVSPSPAQASLDSLYDMVVGGGPLMIPIGICSIVALAYAVERWIRFAPGRLGNARFGKDVVSAVRDGGPARGLDVCDAKNKTPLARILSAGLKRWHTPPGEIEKAVEDAGYREARNLSSKLRPLVVVAMISPLLGLLGTVWGMIEAFSSIALQDGLGKPELLASGIAQALITTAAGLAIAIPTQAAYYYLKSRVDRFVRTTEELWQELSDVHTQTAVAEA